MNNPVADALAQHGWQHVYSGKVRDLYAHDDAPALMLVVASDRVSAFDHVLEPGIPGKGALLTQLTVTSPSRTTSPPAPACLRCRPRSPTARCS